MCRMRKNEKGFGLVELILIIVVIGLIVAVGWLFFDRQKEKNNETTGNNVQQQVVKNTEIQEETKPDPTASWQTYTNDNGKFSFKYPPTWMFANNPEYCSEGLVLFGVKMENGQSSAGKCGADGARAFGQMSVTWRTDRADLSLCGLSDSWSVDTKDSTKVAGVPAVKTSGTYIANDEDMGGNAKGNKVVQYCFVANNSQYLASYTKWADYPDALSDFDQMVTRTFKLN